MEDGIHVLYLKSRQFLALGILDLPHVMRAIHAYGTDIVHIHSTGLLQAALLAALRLRKIPSVWTLHGITEKETWQRYVHNRSPANLARYLFYTLMERFSLAVAQHVIVDTAYVREEAKIKRPVSVIPQGIFSEEFAEAASPSRDKQVILSAGAFSPRKGHHHTLEAFAKVKKQLPESQLVITGTMTDAVYYKRLQQQAEALGLQDSTQLLADIPRTRITALFKEARIFALHSQEESQGIALCEALVSGLPVASTRIGGIPYVISDRQDGLLVEYGDTTAFAEAMISLLTDKMLYERMSTAAISSASRFDWQNIALKVMSIYRGLLCRVELF